MGTLLAWIGDNSFLVAFVAALVGISLKFEHRLNVRFKSVLFVADIVLVISTLLLGLLKGHLDAQWKSEIASALRRQQGNFTKCGQTGIYRQHSMTNW